MSDDRLRDRHSELRAWAMSRIRACREQEQKFGAGWKLQRGLPQALVEAWTERRALQAVLGILDDEQKVRET